MVVLYHFNGQKLRKMFDKDDFHLVLSVQQQNLWKSVRQIVYGLNELYKDFKNTQIKLADAVYMVNRQIAGASNDA